MWHLIPDINEIAIEVSSRSITLKMPKNETDIQFIRALKFVRWDNAQFRWVIPNYGKALELIKNYFNTRITRIETRDLEQPKAIPNVIPTQIITDLPKIDSNNLQEYRAFQTLDGAKKVQRIDGKDLRNGDHRFPAVYQTQAKYRSDQ